MIDDAHDGSAWSAANARYQDFFRQICQRSTSRSAAYSIPAGTSSTPPIRTSIWGQHPHRAVPHVAAARRVRKGVGVQLPRLCRDHRLRNLSAREEAHRLDGRTRKRRWPHRRRDGTAIPDREDQHADDVRAEWAASGMGTTGETYLAGPDDLMRSDSRLILEDPASYRRDVMSAGTPPDIAGPRDSQWHDHLDPARWRRSHPRRTARRVRDDDRRRLSRSGSAAGLCSVQITGSGLHWVIVAKLDTAEAFAREANSQDNGD